ncbi:ribonuclease H-like protein, partial [Armillaria borealis]
NNIITVYTNGTCKLNGDINAQAGSGIWINNDSTINKACRVPGINQNTETGELYAVEYTACKIPKEVLLKIESKSKYMINTITSSLPYYEDKGWIGVQNAHEIKRTIAWLRQRGSNTLLEWVDDHTNNTENEKANQQAIKGQKETSCPKINLRTPIQLNLQGIKLSSLTQTTAYKAIRQKTALKERKSTTINLDIARYAANDLSGHTPTDSRIWISIRSKDITRTTRNFLWMMLHNAYKCGKYWDNIPNYSHRAICLKCGAEESLEHILIDCRQIPAQNIIWKLCEQLWENTGNQWPKITYGKILACGLAQFHNKNNQLLYGKNRLYRILISESTFLIWKLRCERWIAKQDDETKWHSKIEIHNRWVSCINQRLTLDCQIARTYTSKKENLNPKLVLHTWSSCLYEEEKLPDDWIRQPGVLVGIPYLKSNGSPTQSA